MLAFVQLFVTVAHASPGTPVNAKHQKANAKNERDDDRRKRKTVKSTTTKKVKDVARKPRTASSAKAKLNKKLAASHKVTKSQILAAAKNNASKKRYGRQGIKTLKEREALTDNATSSPLKLSKAHRARYQKARETAMNKLMGQLGKPYQWGGTSPETGFDCSGLVWYAYKDLVKFKIPRTANEMYHLRDAAQIDRGELEKGDLVFFRINGRGTADHVGVYLGGGKFIQSPRTGKDIQISALSDDYWQGHYVGARRVMTPKTIR